MHTIQQAKILNRYDQATTKKLLPVLTLVMVVIATLMFTQHTVRGTIVEDDSRRNESQQLAAQATSQLTQDPVASILLATEALPTSESPRPYVSSAEFALTQALHNSILFKDLDTGEINNTVRSDRGISDIDFSDDGKLASVSKNGFLTIWEIDRKNPISTQIFSWELTSVRWLGEEHLLIGDKSGSVIIWSIKRGESHLLYAHEARITYLASAMSKILSVSSDGYVQWARLQARPYDSLKLESTKAGGEEYLSLNEFAKSVQIEAPVTSAEFSSDGHLLVIADANGIAHIVDENTGKTIAAINHGAPIKQAIFTRDSKEIITAGADNSVKIWDSKTFELINTIYHDTPVITMAAGDGFLAIVDKNGKGYIWDLALMKKQGKSQQFNVPVQLSYDETKVAFNVVDANGIKHVWNIYKLHTHNALWVMMLPLIMLLVASLWALQNMYKIYNHNASVSSLEWKLALVMLLYPRSYRQELGYDMICTIIDRYKEKYETGGTLSFLNEFVVSVCSIVINAFREHLAEIREQLSTKMSD